MKNRTPFRPLLAVSCIVSVALALGACGGGSSSAEPASSTSASASGYVTPRTMPEGKGSGEDDGVFPRTVVHFEGSTELDAAPERVVVISTGQADALLTLGVVPVGSTAGDGADMIPGYLEDAFPDDAADLAAVTSVGDRLAPDLETIANLKPDLILMNTAGKDAAAMYQSLNEIAPTVATQGTGLYWKQDFLLLSDALGKRQEAETWLDDYQTEAADFGKGLTDPGNVSFLRLNEDRTRVFGVASFSGSVAEDMGLSRPESQSFTDETSLDISAEQLDLADGDHLFYGVQGGDGTKLTGLPLWDSLAVVQAGRAVAVDDDTFYLNTGPTAARGILSVLEKTLG